MFQLKFDFYGEHQITRDLHQWASSTDPRPVFKEIHKNFIAVERRLFVTRGETIGSSGRWKELSPITQKYKDKHYPGKPPMVATGRGKRSLTEQGHPDHIFKLTSTRLEMGTKVPYLEYHQKRTRSARGEFSVVQKVTGPQKAWLRKNLGLHKAVGDELKLPRRYVILASKEDKSRWSSYFHIYHRHITEGRGPWPPPRLYKVPKTFIKG